MSASEQFGIDFGKFGKLVLKFQMRDDAGASLPPLFGRFEQKLSHLAGSQALHQIIKRAVLESPLAAAIFFAASQVLPDIRSPQQMDRRMKLGQQNSFLLPQSGRGLFLDCLNHKYG